MAKSLHNYDYIIYPSIFKYWSLSVNRLTAIHTRNRVYIPFTDDLMRESDLQSTVFYQKIYITELKLKFNVMVNCCRYEPWRYVRYGTYFQYKKRKNMFVHGTVPYLVQYHISTSTVSMLDSEFTQESTSYG